MYYVNKTCFLLKLFNQDSKNRLRERLLGRF